MKIFYFTATGNSLYVAKRIGGELCSIPQMVSTGQSEFEDDAIGFVFPCYGFGIPRMVTNFVQESKFKAHYFFAVMTYGNMAASGLKAVENAGFKAGIRFDYTSELLMVDNYLPIFSMESQLKNEHSKNIEENLTRIANEVQKRQQKTIRKGLASDAVSKATHKFTACFHYDGGDKGFIVHDTCNKCKVCEKVCPQNNIKVGEKPEFLHACEGCFACIHHCPQNAIHLKWERSNARFINRNVTLKEIIAANNRSN